MSRLSSELRYRLRALFRRSDMESELEEELRFHVERHTEQLIAAGVSADEARRQARLAFGGMERIKEEARDARGLVALETAWQDLRYTVRGLGSRKAFTAGVVLTLGLGIGATATMFGIVDRLLLRAPPFMPGQERVHRVYIHGLDSGEPRTDRNFSYARYLDVHRLTSSFDVIAAFQTRRLAVGDGEQAAEVPVTVASASFFDFFTATPALGRFFDAADDSVPTGSPVVVLGHAFWQTRFGGRRDVIGQELRVDRTLATIIGVAPAGFVGMSDQGVPALYMPITAYAFAFRGPRYPANYNWGWLEIIAKRKAHVSLAAAQVDATQAFRASWQLAYEQDPGWGTVGAVQPRGELGPVQFERGPLAGRDSRVATWIGGVAVIVLLVACANVANLLLSRAVQRRREMAMRLALGVSRGRLLRQLLIESLVLATIGGVAGLAIAQWGGAILRGMFLPVDFESSVVTDGRTLVFAALVTISIAVLTGLVPAFHAMRTELAGALQVGLRGEVHRRPRTATALLIFQSTLSVILLVGAGLFVRSLQKVNGFRLGYDVEPVLFASANPRGVEMGDAEVAALNLRLLEAAASMPGVAYAALAASVPFWSNEGRGLYVAGVDSIATLGRFMLQAGTGDYFATLGTRILRGRPFNERDRENTQPVVVVSEGMARALWPGRDAIGQCIRIDSNTAPCTTVIGVAEEMRVRSLMNEREYTYYVPASQYGSAMYPQVFVRIARGDAAAQVEPLRRRLQALMPGAAYVNVVPLAALVDPNLRAWRFGTTMFVAFGALALVIAAIGLYSMISYGVAQRTRELGVRLALGASARDIVLLIAGHGVRLVLVGVALGSAIALWAAPQIEALMFRVPPRDPVVFGVVVAVLGGVALLAGLLPAVRAVRLDPNVVLRTD